MGQADQDQGTTGPSSDPEASGTTEKYSVQTQGRSPKEKFHHGGWQSSDNAIGVRRSQLSPWYPRRLSGADGLGKVTEDTWGRRKRWKQKPWRSPRQDRLLPIRMQRQYRAVPESELVGLQG